MTRHRSAKQTARDRIRARDRRWYPKRGVCFVCGTTGDTQIHHHRYEIEYNPINFIEVCDTCHKRIHGLRIHPDAQ